MIRMPDLLLIEPTEKSGTYDSGTVLAFIY
jgi:hypothetical protein